MTRVHLCAVEVQGEIAELFLCHWFSYGDNKSGIFAEKVVLNLFSNVAQDDNFSCGLLLLDLQLWLLGCRQAHAQSACYGWRDLAHIDQAKVAVVSHSLTEDKE